MLCRNLTKTLKTEGREISLQAVGSVPLGCLQQRPEVGEVTDPLELWSETGLLGQQRDRFCRIVNTHKLCCFHCTATNSPLACMQSYWYKGALQKYSLSPYERGNIMY